MNREFETNLTTKKSRLSLSSRGRERRPLVEELFLRFPLVIVDNDVSISAVPSLHKYRLHLGFKMKKDLFPGY